MIAADNDHAREQNVGLTKAREAAKAVGGTTVYPYFNRDEKDRGLTDFNDLAASRGKAQLSKVVAAGLKKREAAKDKGRKQGREVAA